jgi:hypothetical protein
MMTIISAFIIPLSKFRDPTSSRSRFYPKEAAEVKTFLLWAYPLIVLPVFAFQIRGNMAELRNVDCPYDLNI